MRFEGIHKPVITPFHADHSIDYDGFRAVLEHVIAAGVHEIVLGGPTGEYYAQTSAERIEMMGVAREIIGDRLPLVIGVGTLRTENAAHYAEAARGAGADAVLIGSPYYAVPTERELALHCLEVERAADLPVMLYNFPSRTGVMMGDEFLDRVGRNPNFCAVKESSGDINRLHALARDYPHIQACCGMDDQALEYFAWGARARVCAGSNFVPREHIALYRACVVDGDFTRGRRIMSAMLPLMRTLEQGGKFLQCIKHGARCQGLPAGPVRRPLRELTKDDARALETTIHTLQTSVRRIESGAEPTDRGTRHVRSADA